MKNNIFKYAAIGLMAMGVASCGDSWLDTIMLLYVIFFFHSTLLIIS
jgi:hypothetical protein